MRGVGCAVLTTFHRHPDNPPMAQGKRISTDIGDDVLHTLKLLGGTAKQARLHAGEGQATAAARLGVHVQTIGRIEAGEPGVAVGHVAGMLALYGLVLRPVAADGVAAAHRSPPEAPAASAPG